MSAAAGATGGVTPPASPAPAPGIPRSATRRLRRDLAASFIGIAAFRRNIRSNTRQRSRATPTSRSRSPRSDRQSDRTPLAQRIDGTHEPNAVRAAARDDQAGEPSRSSARPHVADLRWTRSASLSRAYASSRPACTTPAEHAARMRERGAMTDLPTEPRHPRTSRAPAGARPARRPSAPERTNDAGSTRRGLAISYDSSSRFPALGVTQHDVRRASLESTKRCDPRTCFRNSDRLSATNRVIPRSHPARGRSIRQPRERVP